MLCGAEELLIPQPELVKAAFPVLAGHPPIIKGAQRRTVSPCALAIYGFDSTVHATSAIRADDFGTGDCVDPVQRKAGQLADPAPSAARISASGTLSAYR